NQDPPQQLGTSDLVVLATCEVTKRERGGDGLERDDRDDDLVRGLAHVSRPAIGHRRPRACGRAMRVRAGVEFDRPIRVRLVNESELVHAGLTQLLSEYPDRATVLPPGASRDELADVALVDPFARRHDEEPTVPTT